MRQHMYKKIELYGFLFCLACLSFSSCMDIEEYPDGKITYEDVFSNAKKTAGYLNLCYSQLESFGMSYDRSGFLAGYCSEAYSARDIENGSATRWCAGEVSPTNIPLNGGAWSRYYCGIRYCNKFLANIDTAIVKTETDRKNYKAQAYALRAYYYLQLIKRYGGVPLFTKEIPLNYDYSKIKRATFADCARQIFADCDSVLRYSDDVIGWISGTSDADRGRFNKSTACAIKSQTALYAASPLWADGTITWEGASAVCESCLDSCLAHGYELYKAIPAASDGISAYDAYFLNRSDPERIIDKETILEMNSQYNMYKYDGLPITDGQMYAGDCPTQELVDCYETIDGVQPILGYRDSLHLDPIINPLATKYSESTPYENRDPRLKASIYYNGSVYNLATFSNVYTYLGGNCGLVEKNAPNCLKYTRTGYYMRKCASYKSNVDVTYDGYFKAFRLAELYLNFAEASVEAAIAKGQNTVPAKAYTAVNTVRQRVGMPNLTGLTAEQFKARVRNERRVEMAFEEQDFFDTRRWKTLPVTDNVVTGMKITKKMIGKYEYQRFVLEKRNCATDKFYLFPIPNDEVLRLKNYLGYSIQNPGWE